MVAVWAILPIFGLIVLGYLLGWRGWLSPEGMGGLSTITFRLFMPCLLFTGIARAPLGDALSPLLIALYFLPALIIFTLVNTLIDRRRHQASALGLAGSYSNNVLVGLPLVAALFGDQGLVYLYAILAAHSLILFTAQSVHVALANAEGRRPGLGSILATLKNPLVIALLLGMVMNALGLGLPETVWQMLDWLSRAALPCALLVLGIGLTRYRLRSNRLVWSICALKLIGFPLLVALATTLAGVGAVEQQVLVLLAAGPIGVNALAFATTAEDQRTVGGLVFLSTLLAALTLPLWMAVMA
ncbi:AEC family transporter [Kushneria phosphatilytica]|uniref:AEC family transporter n=1 Tax=Kushneria phosphatilytica TaxID=657387 RepID=A0A1S1NSU8_9GAMM|nr:AEC family transporter [Kushneria phosphatilytica]OHV08414.1 transporter [Kushneria phosphatilytica]QEL09840.1 AEC family transporter [Kushneria phosphatilytica]